MTDTAVKTYDDEPATQALTSTFGNFVVLSARSNPHRALGVVLSAWAEPPLTDLDDGLPSFRYASTTLDVVTDSRTFCETRTEAARKSAVSLATNLQILDEAPSDPEAFLGDHFQFIAVQVPPAPKLVSAADVARSTELLDAFDHGVFEAQGLPTAEAVVLHEYRSDEDQGYDDVVHPDDVPEANEPASVDEFGPFDDPETVFVLTPAGNQLAEALGDSLLEQAGNLRTALQALDITKLRKVSRGIVKGGYSLKKPELVEAIVTAAPELDLDAVLASL